MRVFGMCFACPAFFLFIPDPTLLSLNSSGLGTDLTNWYRRWTQRTRTANKFFNPLAIGIGSDTWLSQANQLCESIPLPFFLSTLCFCYLQMKSSNKHNLNKEQCGTELCPPLYYNLFILFWSLFFPVPTQLLRIADYLNQALSFYDIAKNKPSPGALRCNSISWHL